MRKHLLLLLWLTMLPLAMMAQLTITISPNHAFEITYGDANPTLTNRSWVTMTASGGTNAQNNAFNGSNNAKDQLLARLMLAQDYSTYNAGTYNYTLTHSGNDQFSYNFGGGTGTLTFTIVHSNGTGTRTMTIDRADNAITSVSLDNWAYGETPKTPSVTATNTDGTITYQYSANGTSGWSNTVPTAVGDWYVHATIAQSTNYNAVTSSAYAFKITKAPVTVTLGNVTREWRNPWTPLTVDDITPVVTGGTTNWADVKDYLQWNQVEPIGNAGDQYAYTLDPNGTSPNYDITVSGAGAVVIEKNTTASIGGGGNVLTGVEYTGKAITLNPATALAYRDGQNNEAGKVQYKITAPAAYASTEWLDAVPTATNAGTYTVIYKGVGDVNHTDDEDAAYTYNVTINPYELVAGTDFTAPTAKTDGVYTGSPQAIAIAGEFKGTFAEELATAGAKFIYPTAEALPQQTNANDNYSFDWNIDLGTSTNFSYTAGAKTVTGAKIAKAFITSADYTLPEAVPNLIYTGGNLTLHTALAWKVTPAPGEAYYDRSGNAGTWKTTLRYDVNAGTQTVSTAILPDANHTFEAGSYLSTVTIGGQTAYVVQNDLEVSIAKADLTITNSGSVVTTNVFDGTPQGLVATAPTYSGPGAANVAGTVTYAWNDGTGDKTATTAAGVVATNAGEYAITYTFAPTSNNFNAIEEAQALGGAEAKAKIDQFTLYVGGNEVTGTIEDVYDLETETPLISNSAFLNVEKIKTQFPAADADGIAKAAEILNQLVSPVQTLDEIFANATVTTNTVALKKVDVAPAPGAPMNYKIDEETLLSNAASLTITAKEATIQAAPEGDALTYNGADQKLIKKAAVGYKAMGGAGSVAIGEVVYSLTEDGTYTNDPDEITAKAANQGTDKYTVYYKVELSKEATSLDRFYKYTTPATGTAYIEATIAKKELALGMFTFSDDDMTEVYTGGNLKPTVTAFDAVAGDAEKNALTEDDFTVTVTNSDGDTEEGDLIDVDTYTFAFTAKADGNYKNPATAVTADFEITPKALTADMFALSENVTYTGAPLKPTISTGDEPIDADNDYTIEVKDSKGNLADIDALVDADTYTFNFIAKADGNYKDGASKTWTIGQKALTQEMFALAYETKVYNGENQKPGYTFVDGDPSALAAADFDVTAADKMVDVDAYTFKFTAKAEGNYSGEIEKTFTITQKEVTPTIPKALPLTYNGLDQALVKAGEAEGATIQYKLIDEEGENEFGDAIPEAKNADTYMVAYKFTVDPNYVFTTATEGTVSVKINRAHVKYSLGNQEETYNGTAFDPVENKAYRLVDGDLMLGDAITFTFVEGFDNVNANTGLPFTELAYTGADNYTVEFTTNSGVLTINKAEFAANQYTAPEAITGLVYDPTKDSQVLVKNASVVKVNDVPLGTIKYAFGDSDTEAPETGWTTEVPAKKDAGTYNVWFYVEGDANHVDTDPALIEGVEIAPASLDLTTLLPEEYQDGIVEVYNAAEHTFDITLDGLTEGEDKDYVIEPYEIINAGKYTITITGKNNYAESNLEVPVTINPADLIVIAPNAKKTYDGTTKIENNEFEDPIYVGLQKPDVINFGEGKTFADFVELALEENQNGIDVGTYKTTLTIPAELNKNYTIGAGGSQTGTLAINKAAGVKIGFKDNVSYSKVYGTVNDGLTIVPGDLTAIEGTTFFDKFADIADQLTISRPEDAKGEVVTEEGYTVALGLAEEHPFTANYEKVEFGTGKFFITPYQGEIKVSIASASQTYNGTEPELKWDEENLSNMVVVGLPRDKKDEIFKVLPTITIVGVDENGHAGDYNIELSGGESKNYNIEKIKFLEGSYFTVDPVIVSAQFNSIPVVAEGADATEVLKNVEYEVVAAESDAEVLKKNINKFTLDFKPGFVTTAGKIAAGVNGKDALVLTYNPDEENGEVANFMFEDGELVAKADINIGGEGSTIALDDSGEIVTYESEGSTVTFAEKRNVVKDTWQALVLPFAVTPAEISTAFGYAAVDVLDEERTTGNEIHFCLKVTGDIEAGTPFLFKTDNSRNFKKDEADPESKGVKFENVDLANTADLNPVVVDQDTKVKFIGTFKATTLENEGYCYMSQGTWYDTMDGKKYNIKPLRAYLDLTEKVGGSAARIFIEEPDGTTSIMDINSFNNMLNAEGWYTIEGKKLNAAPTQKGVYIQNGKKVVIK